MKIDSASLGTIYFRPLPWPVRSSGCFFAPKLASC